MIRPAYCILATLLFLGCGGSGGESRYDARGDFADEYAYDRPSQDDLDNVESASENVRRAFGEVEDQVSRFSDGYTNWRDIVPDAESAIDDLDHCIRELDDAVSDAGVELDVDVRRLKRRADNLRDEVERFRSESEWDEIVGDIEEETEDFSSPLGDLDDEIQGIEVYDTYADEYEYDAYDRW